MCVYIYNTAVIISNYHRYYIRWLKFPTRSVQMSCLITRLKGRSSCVMKVSEICSPEPLVELPHLFSGAVLRLEAKQQKKGNMGGIK